MKSIVEEASSIAKAIEQAWNRAGNPSQFSVKIFEEPRKNLFGFTVQSAKIGLIFDEQAGERAVYPPSKERRHEERRHAPVKHALPESTTPLAPKPKNKREMWQPEAIEFVKGWIQQILTIMGLPNMQFSVSIAGNLAKFHFSNHITGKESSDRVLFSSFAHLIMTSLRQKYKKSLHHLKVVFTSS